MRTYIPRDDVKMIVSLSGEHIRQFLSKASADDFRGEAKAAIKHYQANKELFTDTHLVGYGQDIANAINNPMRIEVRSENDYGVAQIVAKGVWGATLRQDTIKELRHELALLDKNIEVRLAGTSSFEFNVTGVNKSCPIRFLRYHWDKVLTQMNYTSGAMIDSRLTKTIIIADGDGTIYDGPKAGHPLPTMATSPARDALVAWLETGGMFMLNSGNELSRNIVRIKDGIPAHLFNRILVCGNGGADLVCFDLSGNPQPVSGYYAHALDKPKVEQPIDAVYLGDDGSEDGNDWAAFKEVGLDKSVLVAKDFKRSYDAGLRVGYVGRLVHGSKMYLEIATVKAKNVKHKPFLSAWALV